MLYIKTKDKNRIDTSKEIDLLIENALCVQKQKETIDNQLKSLESQLLDLLPQQTELIVDEEETPLLRLVTSSRLTVKDPLELKTVLGNRFEDLVSQSIHYRCEPLLRKLILEGYDKEAQACRKAVSTTVSTSFRYLNPFSIKTPTDGEEQTLLVANTQKNPPTSQTPPNNTPLTIERTLDDAPSNHSSPYL